MGETEYLISTVPLGGYVKLLGENEEESEDLSPEEASRAFNHQHVLKRLAIVAAGPFFNLFLALFLFWGVYAISGNYVMTTEVGQVREDSPAARAGLLKGDVIVSVQGIQTGSWTEIKDLVKDSAGQGVTVTVQREGRLLSVTVVPEESVEKNLFGEDVKSALIGIVSAGKYRKVEMGPLEALKEGIRKTWEITTLTFLTVVKLFQGVVSIKTLGGPIMIGQLTGQVAQEASAIWSLSWRSSASTSDLESPAGPHPGRRGDPFPAHGVDHRQTHQPQKRDMAQKLGISF